MKQLRTVVADDHRAFRAALVALLSSVRSVRVVGTAADGHEALRCVEELQPDLLLLDINMPGLNGWQVLDALAARGSQVHVIILSSHELRRDSSFMEDVRVEATLRKGNPKGVIDAIVALAKRLDVAES